VHGRIISESLQPTPKGEQQLSVDTGQLMLPSEAWVRSCADGAYTSAGVMGVSVFEGEGERLSVVADGKPYAEHCYLDFQAHGRKETEQIAKKLRNYAAARGWLYQSSGA
jgi:hypothetical protein